MFADPGSITINAIAIPLPRTSAGLNVGTLTSNDGATKIDVAHTYGKRIRRSYALTVKKYSPNPADSTQNIPVSATIRLTVDQPLQGYSVADLQFALLGFIGNLTAGTNANIAKLLGGEN